MLSLLGVLPFDIGFKINNKALLLYNQRTTIQSFLEENKTKPRDINANKYNG